MSLTIEQFNLHTPDEITMAAAQLIVSEAFGGNDTVAECLESLAYDGMAGRALVADRIDVVGALTLYHDAGSTNLIGIAVPELERSKGYGKLLIRYAAVQALDAGSQSLYLTPATDEVRGFFERFGFQENAFDSTYMSTSPIAILTAKV